MRQEQIHVIEPPTYEKSKGLGKKKGKKNFKKKTFTTDVVIKMKDKDGNVISFDEDY